MDEKLVKKTYITRVIHESGVISLLGGVYDVILINPEQIGASNSSHCVINFASFRYFRSIVGLNI